MSDALDLGDWLVTNTPVIWKNSDLVREVGLYENDPVFWIRRIVTLAACAVTDN